MEDEQKMKEEYAAAGVDLPELKEEPKAEEPKEPAPKEESTTEEPPKEDAPKEEPEAENEPLQEPKQPRKRSIYDEYKDKKSELKTERELREKAEKERDELQTKVAAYEQAKTPEAKADAKDKIEAYAQEIGADPAAVRKIVELAREGLTPQIPEEIVKDFQTVKEWKAQHANVVEKQLFEEEFTKTVPAIKSFFPTVSEEELVTIKKELDTLSHTKDWHDKDLEYIAYKHKDTLAKLVSPKKRGMETKGRKDVEIDSFEFDPNADYASLTPAQQEKWEAEYRKATKSDGLLEDAQGRKIIL